MTAEPPLPGTTSSTRCGRSGTTPLRTTLWPWRFGIPISRRWVPPPPGLSVLADRRTRLFRTDQPCARPDRARRRRRDGGVAPSCADSARAPVSRGRLAHRTGARPPRSGADGTGALRRSGAAAARRARALKPVPGPEERERVANRSRLVTPYETVGRAQLAAIYC